MEMSQQTRHPDCRSSCWITKATDDMTDWSHKLLRVFAVDEIEQERAKTSRLDCWTVGRIWSATRTVGVTGLHVG